MLRTLAANLDAAARDALERVRRVQNVLDAACSSVTDARRQDARAAKQTFVALSRQASSIAEQAAEVVAGMDSGSVPNATLIPAVERLQRTQAEWEERIRSLLEFVNDLQSNAPVVVCHTFITSCRLMLTLVYVQGGGPVESNERDEDQIADALGLDDEVLTYCSRHLLGETNYVTQTPMMTAAPAHRNAAPIQAPSPQPASSLRSPDSPSFGLRSAYMRASPGQQLPRSGGSADAALLLSRQRDALLTQVKDLAVEAARTSDPQLQRRLEQGRAELAAVHTALAQLEL